jgi:hypothetical protein
MTGKSYEKYVGVFDEIANVPLVNEATEIDDDDEDVFEDQFEEDLEDERLIRKYGKQYADNLPITFDDNDIQNVGINAGSDVNSSNNGDGNVDLSSSRFSIYDAFASSLSKYVHDVI